MAFTSFLGTLWARPMIFNQYGVLVDPSAQGAGETAVQIVRELIQSGRFTPVELRAIDSYITGCISVIISEQILRQAMTTRKAERITQHAQEVLSIPEQKA